MMQTDEWVFGPATDWRWDVDAVFGDCVIILLTYTRRFSGGYSAKIVIAISKYMNWGVSYTLPVLLSCTRYLSTTCLMHR